jgi:hypothetical protein
MLSQTTVEPESNTLHYVLARSSWRSVSAGRGKPEHVHLDAKGAYEDGGQHDGIASEESAAFSVSVCVQRELRRAHGRR